MTSAGGPADRVNAAARAQTRLALVPRGQITSCRLPRRSRGQLALQLPEHGGPFRIDGPEGLRKMTPT
jgi:hypothetical protein